MDWTRTIEVEMMTGEREEEETLSDPLDTDTYVPPSEE